MKPFATTLALLATLVFTGSALGNQYGWTISNSNSDPFSNEGTATNGVATLFLWFECSDVEGMAAAEFDLVSSGINHLATTAVNGYLNAGGTTNILLAVGGCPTGPVIAANLLVLDTPGTMCFGPSANNGLLVTVDCQPQPTAFEATTNGYSSMGANPCAFGNPLCLPDAVETTSFGEIKGLYR